jgi:hypothetical protein
MALSGIQGLLLGDKGFIRPLSRRTWPARALICTRRCATTWGCKPEPQKIPSPIDALLKISLRWAYNRNLPTAEGAIDRRP